MPTLAFIGAGAMGEAIARGLITSGLYAPADIVLYSRTSARVQALAQSLGARTALSAEQAVRGADVVILAVKPYAVEEAIASFREALTPQQTLISVAAGVSLQQLETYAGDAIPVVRSMPNTPSMVSAGATAICGGTHATRENLDKARAIFSALGLCVDTEEKLFDAVTGLSGSGPAYVFLFIEALADGGVRAGLRRDVALQLAAQTVLGGAQMVLETGKHPGVLKDQVASPGGTTIAALHALENGAFRGTVMNAVIASANRSRELT
ncbi:pyrroline-5-carboxylate reductase [bacterium]|nr:MAG: pyrroline-5-carboxylate reductase [bacterium]